MRTASFCWSIFPLCKSKVDSFTFGVACVKINWQAIGYKVRGLYYPAQLLRVKCVLLNQFNALLKLHLFVVDMRRSVVTVEPSVEAAGNVTKCYL